MLEVMHFMLHKPYHTAVCAIAKDENPYVLEWVAYHLALGFEHVFLYDNMSAQALSSAFSIRYSSPHLTIQLWPTIIGRNAQLEAYTHHVLTRGREVEWTAFIDLDEMINLKRHDTVRDFLEPWADADGVAVNWRIFGSSGEKSYQPGLVMGRFTRASSIEFGPNQLIKSIVRTERVVALTQHHAFYRGEPKIVASDGTMVENGSHVGLSASRFAVAQINHYFTRSSEEWARKLRRGYTDETVRDPEMFREYDINEVEERSILKRRAETSKWMRRICAGRDHRWPQLFCSFGWLR